MRAFHILRIARDPRCRSMIKGREEGRSKRKSGYEQAYLLGGPECMKDPLFVRRRLNNIFSRTLIAWSR